MLLKWLNGVLSYLFFAKETLNENEFMAAYQQGRRNFSDSRIVGVDFSQLQLRSLVLTGADLRFSHGFTNADLRQCRLVKARLDGLDLQGVDLQGANLYQANLKGTNLNGANLNDSNLSKAQLTGASLHAAGLKGSNLSGANLSGANFSWADLRNANLSGAKLVFVNLSWSDLDGCHVGGTVFWQAQLDTARLPWQTILVWFGLGKHLN